MKGKILLFLVAMFVFVFGAGVTYSAFTSDASLALTDQKIAKFIFEAKEYDTLELPIASLLPGESQEFAFSVTNSKEGDVANVSLNYKIVLTTFHFIPFNIELYSKVGEEKNLVMTCDESYSRNDQHELVCNSDIFSMEHNASQLDEYILKVTFPEEYNQEEYSDLADFLDISVQSYQKIGR